VSVSQAQLDMVLGGGGGGGRSADHATALVRGGLLTLKGEGEYFFAVPRAGPFLRMRRKGNTELLGILRRAPYKEMLLARLELRRLRSSSFPALFHIRDVIGSGAAESVATSLGLLVRVVRGAGEPAHAY
jgi:Serine-threonine protein kinase 19